MKMILGCGCKSVEETLFALFSTMYYYYPSFIYIVSSDYRGKGER